MLNRREYTLYSPETEEHVPILRRIERFFQPPAGQGNIFTGQPEIDNEILLKVRHEVRDALGANLQQRIMDQEIHERKKKYLKPQKTLWNFLKNRRHFYKEYPVLRSGTDKTVTPADLETAVQREVAKPVFMSPERLFQLFQDAPNVPQDERDERKEIRRLLEEKLGSKVVSEAQDHPIFLWALAFLFQLQGQNRALPPPAGQPAQQYRFRLEFLKKALGKKKTLGALNSEQMSGTFSDLKKYLDEMSIHTREMQKYGGADLLQKLLQVYSNFYNAKQDYDAVNNNPPPPNAADAAGRAYVVRLSEARKDREDARHGYETLVNLHRNFRQSLANFGTSLKGLIPQGHALENDPNVRKLTEQYLQRVPEFDPAHPPSPQAITDFAQFFQTVTNKTFEREWLALKPHFDGELKKLQEGEAKEEDKSKGAPKMQSEELLYNLYYQYFTNEQMDGGELPNNVVLTDMAKNKRREQALWWTRFSVSEAKDMNVYLANKIRAERLYRVQQTSTFRKKLLWPFRTPFTTLPQLDTLFQRLRIVEVARTPEGKVEKPFAEVALKSHMTKAHLRKMIFEKKLKVDDIPLLIAHLEALLEGYNKYQLRYEDVHQMCELIRNLRIVRQEQKHEHFLKELAKEPGTFPDKLAKLWQDDFAEEDKLQQESAEKVVKEVLFQTVSGRFFNLKASKEYREKLEGYRKEAQTKMDKGEWTAKDAIDFLKKNGVPIALATGLLLGIGTQWRKFRDFLKQRFPKTPKEVVGKKERGLFGRAGYQMTRPFRWTGRNLIVKPIKGLVKLTGAVPNYMLIKPIGFAARGLRKGLVSGPRALKNFGAKGGRGILHGLRQMHENVLNMRIPKFGGGSGGQGAARHS